MLKELVTRLFLVASSILNLDDTSPKQSSDAVDDCGLIKSRSNAIRPIIVATWPFVKANEAGWQALINNGSALDGVTAACTEAEDDRDVPSVGYGCSPDELGQVTLDALVMDGKTMKAGAVAGMPEIREACQVAREVLDTTDHTLLVGSSAADFAASRGFQRRPLNTSQSDRIWTEWINNHCQPNYRHPGKWEPDPKLKCGPYQRPNGKVDCSTSHQQHSSATKADPSNHDTIGVVVIDASSSMAVGTSTSGMTHRIPGRVGDSPIVGAGGYVDNAYGGAVATGDGDVLMRFLPTYQIVQFMARGIDPTEACRRSLDMIDKRQQSAWSGAVVALAKDGRHGAACVGFQNFSYTVHDPSEASTRVVKVKCERGHDPS